MPTYEMVLLLQRMDRTGLKKALKRSAEYIFEVGGIVRKMENLGAMDLPYRIVDKERSFTSGHCFIMKYDAALDKFNILRDKFKLDQDVVRATSFIEAWSLQEAYQPKEKPECTLHLDLLPPPYRPAVIAIEEKQKQREKKRFHFNTGLDYNPV